MQRTASQSRLGRNLPTAIAVMLFLATLLFNAFTYAAFAARADVGPPFRRAIADDAPIILIYVRLGDALRGLPGLETLGDATAAGAAEPLAARIAEFPPGASAVFFGDPQPGDHDRMRWTHRILPFLLLAVVFFAWRRQKPVHLRQRLRA